MHEDQDIEAELKAFADAEAKKLGISREQWVEPIHANNRFKASDRPHTTLLVSGLTMAHDFLVAAALRGLGYAVEMLDCPTRARSSSARNSGTAASATRPTSRSGTW